MKMEKEFSKKKLKVLRVIHDLTQAELAQKIGTNQEQISRWENGVKIPTLCSLIKLSTVLDVTLDEFLDSV